MYEWKRNLIRMFLYAGMEREEYEGIQIEIQNDNTGMLAKVTRIALCIFGGLYLASCVIGAVADNQPLYLCIFLLLALLEGLRRSLSGRFPNLILPMCYFLLLIVYGYGIWVGTVQVDFPATTFCVFLFAGPFLFVDKPYRMTLFMLIMCVVFCIISCMWKPHNIATLDIINCISFYALGVFSSLQLLHIKAKSLVHNKKMTNERDTDGLTGLLVKTALERDICHYIKMTRDAGALIIIDLDNFKTINDTMGHAYGDRVLELAGSCIERAFGVNDIKGRFGGDEFVIFVRGKGSRKLIMERLEKFRALMDSGTGAGSGLERVSQSIGVALYPEDAGDYKALFEKADEALYEAKRRGKDQYCFYTSVRINRQTQGKES